MKGNPPGHVLGLINRAPGDSPSGVIGAKGVLDGATGHFPGVRRFIGSRDEKMDVIARGPAGGRALFSETLDIKWIVGHA